MPFCHEAVDVVARNAEQIRKTIRRPLILENITYGIKMPGAEMNEEAFLREVFEATGCGWLPDVTNLYINSENHGDDLPSFLDEAPLERVVQLHYVGFSVGKGGKLVDNHGAAVNEEIWIRHLAIHGALYRKAAGGKVGRR